MPAGRPTDYKPEYCESVVKWGTLGKSKAWMCAELNCARSTLDLWIDTHEEFSYAMQNALNKSQQWWEESGQKGITAPNYNGSLWARNVTSRFTDWREKSETTTTLNLDDKTAELLGLVSGKTRSL